MIISSNYPYIRLCQYPVSGWIPDLKKGRDILPDIQCVPIFMNECVQHMLINGTNELLKTNTIFNRQKCRHLLLTWANPMSHK
jgi:hypothetical protein